MLHKVLWLHGRLARSANSQNESFVAANEEQRAVDATATSFERRLADVELKFVVFFGYPKCLRVLFKSNDHGVVGIEPGASTLRRAFYSGLSQGIN